MTVSEAQYIVPKLIPERAARRKIDEEHSARQWIADRPGDEALDSFAELRAA